MAQEGDTVLIAGKGHQKTINIKGKLIQFDDCVEATKALQKVGYPQIQQRF